MGPFRASLLAVLVLCVASLPGFGAVAVAEPRPLLDGRAVGGWQAEEATLERSIVEGEQVASFRVSVDWKAGEPNYPIGWPRLHLAVPPEQADWRGWEQLRLRVLARSSAGRLPFRPLGVTISSGSARISWEKEVEALPVGAWQEVVFDLRDVPDPGRIRSVGVYISEDKYQDGERLEFAIARLELLRYTQPTLLDLQPVAGAMFADAPSLPVRVKVLGLSRGATAPVELRLGQGDREVATRQARAGDGETQLSIPLPKDLSPGEYTLSGTAGGRTISAAVTLVASPWQEVKR